MRIAPLVFKSPIGGRALAAASAAACLILSSLLWIFFSPWLALWTLAMGAVFRLRPAAGLALLIPAISIDRAEPVWGGIVVSLSEFEFGVCLLVFVFCLSSGSLDPSALDWRWLRWGGGFAVAVLISAAVNNEWWRVAPHAVRQSEMIAAGWLACNVIGRRRDRPWVQWSIVASAALFSCIAIFQSPSLGSTRSAAVFTNPNQFGAYLNLLLPFLLLFLVVAVGAARKILLTAVLALTLLAQLIAQSRAAWAATLLLTAVFLWLVFGSGAKPPALARVKLRGLLPLAVVVVLSGALLAGGLWVVGGDQYFTRSWKAFKDRTRVASPSDFFRSRLLFYRLGWDIWRDNPWVGIGPGNYEERVVDYRSLWADSLKQSAHPDGFQTNIKTHAHNLALQLAVNFGLLGLAAFAFLIGRLVLDRLRSIGTDPWAVAGLALLAGFLTHNLLDVTFPSLGWEMGLLLGATTPLNGSSAADGDGRKS